MMLTVTHAKVTSGTINDDVEVDLADWNAAHTLAGTADASQLNSNVVQSVTNDANIQGVVSSQTLVFSWGGTLSAARGGFGANVSSSSGVPLFATGVPTFTGTTGSGDFVRATSPTLVTPALGTPASGTLTNCTGLPLSGLTNQAAYSIVGNFTGSSAAPTASTIGGLTQKASPTTSDLVLVQDQAASGAMKFATIGSLPSTSGVSSIAGNTGAFTLSNGITNSTNDIRIDTGNLPGIASNIAAAAGNVGEVIGTTGTSAGLSNNVTTQIATISLTAGDWDVSGSIVTNTGGGTNTTDWYASISATTASLTNIAGTVPAHVRQASASDTPANIAFPPAQVLLSGTTSYYLNVRWTGSGTAPTVTWAFRGRRMR